MRGLRWFTIVLACVAAVLAAVLLHDRLSPGKPLLHARTDFTTFYCAGTVTRERADAYHVEPMRACEHRLGEFDEPGRAPWEVIPAPFPGYVLALYALVSLLPFGAAHLVWFGVLLVSIGVTAWALARVTGFNPVPIAIVLAAILGFWNLAHGEPTPIVAALLALAAERARRGAWPAAGVLTALGMIMPQLVLPAFLALLLFAPRARAALVVTAAALGALSLATVGVAGNVEYFTRTLPLQTASEVYFDAQFSVTHLLASYGVPEHAAILLGSASYLVLVAVAIWTGVRLMRAGGQPACLVLIPSAVASAGGSYSHEMQVMTGVCATILFASLRAVPSAAAVVPLALFSVMWMGDSAWRGLLAVTTVSGLAGLWLAADRLAVAGMRRAAFIAVSAVVLAAGFGALHRLPQANQERSIAAAPAPAIGPDDGISSIWGYRNRLEPFLRPDVRLEASKLPYVAGLLVIVGCAFGVRRSPQHDQASAGFAEAFPGASSRTIVS